MAPTKISGASAPLPTSRAPEAPAPAPPPETAAPTGWFARAKQAVADDFHRAEQAVVREGHAVADGFHRVEQAAVREGQALVGTSKAVLDTAGRSLEHLEDFAKMLAATPFKPALHTVQKADPTTGPMQPGVSLPTTGNTIVPFVDGDGYRQQLLSHIDHAQKSIWLNTYEWQDNAQGAEVVAALERAKARGVDIHLVVDNRDRSGEFAPRSAESVRNEPLMQRLAKVGDLRFVDHDAFRVNHRKVAVFDGTEAMVMGMNIGANYMLPLSAGWTYHDAGLVLSGPAVRDVADVFADSYAATGGTGLKLPDRMAPLADGPNTEASVQVIQHSWGDRNIERELVQRIDASKDDVVLANGFSMEQEIYDAVLRARARGVKVTILTGDASPTTTLLAQRRFPGLLNAGVELRQSKTPLHLKAYQFDHTYTMVGSSNLDGSSNWRNDEVMTLVSGQDFAKEFADQALTPQLAAATPITTPPARPTSLKERAIQELLGPLLDG